MSEIVFRPAQSADLPSIVALLADDDLGRSREDASVPLNGKYVDAFDALQRDPNQLLAVLVVRDVVVGCIQISFIPGLSRLGMWRGQIESVRIASNSGAKDWGAGSSNGRLRNAESEVADWCNSPPTNLASTRGDSTSRWVFVPATRA